ncbi:putative membrane protein SpoIIM required for sporulation [Silvimonas terrae]|uniref:Putative membrane protein SpoIIM required for sporulation n=1 Tax=Silvimonas terrae TaxID=300266 RepID=A0A840RLB3_9NEIS|nr:stage II sporulation protein M [Silvimonas terrae]MBB5192911.1 putative membrane protein SpoIIM required for sporulation [Silvimonas terrae]
MKQLQFEAENQATWKMLERELKGRPSRALPGLYRTACLHLALARDRHYAVTLQDRLHDLVVRTHEAMYGERPSRMSVAEFLLRVFPRTVRAQWRVVALSMLLLFGPFFLLNWLVSHNPDLAASFLSRAKLNQMSAMYSHDAAHWGRQRGADSDVQMFGYYIYNNISINFRTFASGIFFGLGSVFFMVFNGITAGVIAGYLSATGSGDVFWPFVCGHSAPEATAAALAGASGLHLGAALLWPGRLPRLQALRVAAQTAFILLGGAALMTFFAAFIEAFWSSRVDIPAQARFVAGAVLWSGIWLWLLVGGRRKGKPDAS